MRTLGAVIAAAGKGTRMHTEESKQYLLLNGKPILAHTLEVFERADEVSAVVVVAGTDDIDRCRGYIEEYGLAKIQAVVAGGKERQLSVYEGLKRLDTEWVVVHDGVRPFVTVQDIVQCWWTAMVYGSAVTAVPVKDTIKIADESGMVRNTPERKSLWTIQTPQAFRRVDLMAAHERAMQEGYFGTDDAALAERSGMPVKIVEGNYDNIKITTPEDLLWAEFMLTYRRTEGESP